MSLKILKSFKLLILCAIIVLPNDINAQIAIDNIEIKSHIWEFRPQSKYLVDRGMVAVVATYRVKRHGRTIFESIADAKSAIRWIREHADELGIDANLLAAGGGSAGAYLAACSALHAPLSSTVLPAYVGEVKSYEFQLYRT